MSYEDYLHWQVFVAIEGGFEVERDDTHWAMLTQLISVMAQGKNVKDTRTFNDFLLHQRRIVQVEAPFQHTEEDASKMQAMIDRLKASGVQPKNDMDVQNKFDDCRARKAQAVGGQPWRLVLEP